MRPVDRGKNPKKFNHYRQAQGDLIKRLDDSCSYCEMKLHSAPQVEHVLPKIHHPELICQWDNLLLSCAYCNPRKGHRDIKMEDYLWPDKDNTFLAFIYSEGGRITVNPGLNNRQKECARNLLDLVGLRKNPANDPGSKDRRWIKRKEAWDKAIRSLRRLSDNNTEEMREEIFEHAFSRGNWSIWMTVFKKDMDMLKRLLEKFPGTCRECFDEEARPVPREGGVV